MWKTFLEEVKLAIENGRTDVVRLLISETENGGTNLSNVSSAQFTPDVIINDVVNEEGTLLHMATKMNQVDIVRLLLASGADPVVENENGQNAVDLAQTDEMHDVYTEELFRATAQANLARIAQLIAAGVSVNTVDSPKSGNTALHWAATFANKDVINYLLDREANVNATNSNGATPLHDAVLRGDEETIKVLVERGANPLIKAVKGKFNSKSPLDLSSANSRILPFLQEAATDFANGLHESEHRNFLSSSVESLSSVTHDTSDFQKGKLALSFASNKEISESQQNLSTQSSSAVKPMITSSKLRKLWPFPQTLIQSSEASITLNKTIVMFIIPGPDKSVIHEIKSSWPLYEKCIEKFELRCEFNGSDSFCDTDDKTCVVVHVNSNLFHTCESYRLSVADDKISIVASDLPGFKNAMFTLIQLLKLFMEDGFVPQISICDAPRISYRGIMINMCNNTRVSTLNSLLHQISIAASLKINQIYFYFRFSTRNDVNIAFSHQDLIKIGHHCHSFGTESIPAIDVEEDFSQQEMNRLISFLERFLNCFSSDKFLFVGPQLTAFLLTHSSTKNLLSFLRISSRTTLIICYDHLKPNLPSIASLPDNIITMIYCSWMNDDFMESCRLLHQSGKTFGIVTPMILPSSLASVPETINFNNFRINQFLRNKNPIAILSADWTDVDFPIAEIFNWPAIVCVAGIAWNNVIQWEYLHSIMEDVLNYYVFEDKSGELGKIIMNLGRAESCICVNNVEVDLQAVRKFLSLSKSTTLLQFLLEPDDVNLEHMNNEIFAKTISLMKRYQMDLTKTCSCSPMIECWKSETQFAIDLIHFVCKLGRALVTIGQNPNASMGVAVINLGIANLAPTTRTDLANKLLALIDECRKVWLQSNLENGLEIAERSLSRLFDQMIPGGKSLNPDL